jgi:proteic killer suppression protein
MDVEFKTRALDRLEIDPSFTGGFPPQVVDAYCKRLRLIRSAPDERALYALKALHFEKLKGNYAGRYSMRRNRQWRLIVELVRKPSGTVAVIVDIADYH